MDNRIVFLTAVKSSQGQTYTKPRVHSIPEETISEVIPGTTNGLTMVKCVSGQMRQPSNNHTVYESPLEVEAARNPSSTDIYVKSKVKVGLAALGTTQGAALALTGYINEVTTITAASAEAVKLPAATVGKVVIIINSHATAAVKPFPSTGEFIDAALVNAVGADVVAGKRATYVCVATAGKWVRADDYTQD